MQWEFDFLHWNWEKLHGSAFWNTINKWLTAVGDAIPVAIWLTVIVVIMLFFKKTRKTGHLNILHKSPFSSSPLIH